MKKILLVLLCLILLSSCIVLNEGEDQAKLLGVEATAQSTCPVCPTCEPAANIPNTRTPTPTQTRVITSTPTSTSVPATNTPGTVTPPTRTPTVTKTTTVTSQRFSLQNGMPIYLQNFVHDDKGCNWMGIAGQVFDGRGDPVTNVVVVVKGTLNGTAINSIALTGYPSSTPYGPGGFEVQLSGSVINSTGSLSIQLFDVSGGAISNAFPVTTYASCSKNLILINFVPAVP